MTQVETHREISARIGELLIPLGWTVATAESCTGGLISHYITNVSGSSAYFVGGVVAYDNRVKNALLGVPEEILAKFGAVSAQVARRMAQGAQRLFGAHIGIASTGIAGPTGGTPEKPVGTVYIAVCSPDADAVERHVWGLDREGNKRLSAEAAMALVERLLIT